MKPERSRTEWVALTVLRVVVGWHFLYEGIAKLLKPGWSAAGFLSESKWLFAPLFHWMATQPTVLAIVNPLNIWGLILIGLGLMVGCLTSVAGYAGMALVSLYYLCNPPMPGLYYALPSEGNYLIVNKNLVEIAALYLLAVTRAGDKYGLDRIWKRLLRKE